MTDKEQDDTCMDTSLLHILSDFHIPAFFHENIRVVKTKNSKEGIEIGKNLLAAFVDRQTVLFLSGGSTPKPLYALLADEKMINPAAVALIDERYGEPMHEQSNEKMIADTGFLDYLHIKNIPFYSILQSKKYHYEHGEESQAIIRFPQDESKTREQLDQDYDETVRYLLHNFPKSIGILGIGSDGHTAGIPVKNEKLKKKSQNLVTNFTDFPGVCPQRITMTFLGLSMLDIFIVLVFGKEKKKALEKMFMSGSEEEIPARFFLRPEIAKKTLVITDQKI